MHAPITIKLANKKSSSKIAGPNLIKMRERRDSALSIRRVVFFVHLKIGFLIPKENNTYDIFFLFSAKILLECKYLNSW